METILIVMVLVLDILLFGYVYFTNKQKEVGSGFLGEMKEERKIIDELRASLKDQLSEFKRSVQSAQDKLVAIASEAEIDHKNIKSVFDDNSKSLVLEFEAKLDAPLKSINERCERAHSLFNRINIEKDSLLKALKKAETITKFFNGDIAYRDLLEEIEDKKYSDARQMLSRGVRTDVVASELNMAESEVKLILNIG